MTVKTETTEKPPKPPWRVRLRSWKWWVYGDAYSQPLDKLPKGFYKSLAIATTAWVLIAFHPWVTTLMNREPPAFDTLKVVQGIIVATAEKNPHVILKTREGVNLEMEFPVFKYAGAANTKLPGSQPRSIQPQLSRLHGHGVVRHSGGHFVDTLPHLAGGVSQFGVVDCAVRRGQPQRSWVVVSRIFCLFRDALGFSFNFFSHEQR